MQVDGLLCAVEQGLSVEEIMEYEFDFADEDGTHIDSQWWSLDNTFPMRSQSLIDARSFAVPSYVSEERVQTFQRWKESGLNIAKRYVAECRRRNLEAFYSYRLSETLKDFANGRSGELLLAEDGQPMQLHPDWVIEGEWEQPLLDFRVEEVRAAKVRLLRELAADYDFDGYVLLVAAPFASHLSARAAAAPDPSLAASGSRSTSRAARCSRRSAPSGQTGMP